MVCLAPRAPGDSVRPRRPAGVVVRPLNFTVRGRVLAQLVYETTDTDFANRAIQALRDADISCYRVGHGYSNRAAEVGFQYPTASESQVCIYIERDSDYAEANRILISLGAVVESTPRISPWIIGVLVVVALLVATWVAAAWDK